MICKGALCACLSLGAVMAAGGCSRLEQANQCASANPDTRIAGCTALLRTGHLGTRSLTIVYDNLGAAYSRNGDHARAIQDYSQAIRLNSNDAAAYLGRCVSYYVNRDYDHAIQDLDKLASLDLRNAPSYPYRGLVPNRASAYYYLGNAHASRGLVHDSESDYGYAIQDYKQAIQDYSEVIRLNPRYALAYLGRGLAYDSRGIEHDNAGDYNRAIQDYNEAILLSPNIADAYTYRGAAYNHEGEYDRAIQDFDKAIRLNPKDIRAYMGRGAAHNQEGEYGRAIRDFDEVIRLNPKDTVAYLARGDSDLYQSNLAEAVSDFEKVISGAPSSRMAVSAAPMLHVAMRRQRRDDSRQLEQVAAAADLSQWPGPVLKLDMGKMTAGEVMEAAANPRDARQKWHVCQANYFIGEDALFHNQRATALARLKAARDGCPKWGDLAAVAELRRLGVRVDPSK